jgi:hypothetical protein
MRASERRAFACGRSCRRLDFHCDACALGQVHVQHRLLPTSRRHHATHREQRAMLCAHMTNADVGKARAGRRGLAGRRLDHHLTHAVSVDGAAHAGRGPLTPSL